MPSVLRANKPEYDIYFPILTDCAQEFDSSMTYGEILFKMQHYGIPTRLLDITLNPLIALYFACTTEQEAKGDGAVHILAPDENYIKNFHSDGVSMLASLPRIKPNDYDEICDLVWDYLQDYKDEESDDKGARAIAINEFNKNKSVRKLLNKIKAEKPYFDKLLRPTDLFRSVIYIPRQNNARIIRQNGAFMLIGMEYNEIDGLEEFDAKIYHGKITVDGSSRHEILRERRRFALQKRHCFQNWIRFPSLLRAEIFPINPTNEKAYRKIY